VILDHSLGKISLLHQGVQYRVRFHADICYPHKGQTFIAPVGLKSKIGIHAELSPIRVLLPRDLHIGNAEFENIKEGEDIKFEVLGAEFKQNDDAIFILGRFIERVGVVAPVVEEPQPEEVAPAPAPQGEVKQIVVKEGAQEEKKAPRRRKRLNPGETLQVNVGDEAAQGEAQG
jgi:hypothetical protein